MEMKENQGVFFKTLKFDTLLRRSNFNPSYLLFSAASSGGSWGISSIFSGNDTTHSNGMDPTTFTNNFSDPISNLEPRFATIQLREVHGIAFFINCHMMNFNL